MTDANMSVAREKSGGTVKNGGSTMLRTRSVGGCLHSMESGLRGWKRFESDVSATRSLKSLDSGFCLEEKSEAEKKENRKEGNVEAENARKESMKLFRRDSAIVSVDAVEEKG